jgi:hypothetical protein
MGFKLAEMFVDITANDKPAINALGRLQGAFSGFYGKLAGLAAGVGIGAFVSKSIAAASDLAESLDFANIVFGDQYGEIDKFTNHLNDRFGMSKRASTDLAVGLAGIGKNLGKLDGKELTDFTKSVSMMAIDMASAMNLTEEEAQSGIQILLSGGTSERMTQKGIKLGEEEVKKFAESQGLDAKNLTEQEKLAMRLIMLDKQLADTRNNRAMTEAGTANLQRNAMGQLETVMVKFGQTVQPIWNQLLMTAVGALKGIGGWITANMATVSGWVSGLTEWLGAAGVLFSNWGLGVQIVQIQFSQYMTNIQEWVSWVFGAIGQYGEWFSTNWVSLIQNALNAVWTIFQNVFTNVVNLVKAAWAYITNPAGGFNFEFKGLLDGFDSTLAKLPEIAAPHLSNFQSQIDDVTTKMGDAMVKAPQMAVGDMETKTATDIANSMLGRDGQAAQVAGGEAAQQARTSSLESFASSLITGAFGKDKIAKDQLAVQKETRDILKAGGLGGAAGAVVGVAG